ncbi:hypothetical protein PHLGIDRAFT_19397 [Phlebiopsis gigantea 11061_1 CR5-6]|uniref:Uncharacterized protein n=1 Tax=Phlebiopsis gigantea (strain 11061_1 CR5-6) TaxID=745531 RepID=A0A0C3NNH3_PHLG1|nr:hypothetical protein PHLGIDRAFT_19397 [Phlebiopsis gigantea 11061_1 CR5-6]
MAAWHTTASSRVFNSTHLSATTSSPARKQTTRRPITAPQFSSSMGYHQSPCGEAIPNTAHESLMVALPPPRPRPLRSPYIQRALQQQC